jgi:hypothetical protein
MLVVLADRAQGLQWFKTNPEDHRMPPRYEMRMMTA